MLLINVYHEGQIMNTLTGVGYDIHVACTFSADKTISIHDLKRHIHVDLNCFLVISTSPLVYESTPPHQVRVIFLYFIWCSF
jgi:hypothetical protein